MNWAEEYLRQIRDGTIAAPSEVRLTYERLEREAQDDAFPFCFNPQRGQRVIDFIEQFCRHYEGEWAGQLVKLDLWQKAFIQTLFGWLSKDNGMRRFREFMMQVARKNGKSMLSACIMVYMLVADGEAGAQCVSIATKYDQAAIVYKTARKIIEQDADLRALVLPVVGGMEFKATSSTMKALASKSKTLDGLNLHYVSCDELHAQEDRNLYDVTRQGMKARKQPMFGSITTAGFAQEGIYESLFEYAQRIALGEVEDARFLPLLYKLDERAEWTDPACWQKANPGLGTIKSFEQLADDVQKARNDNSYLPTLLVKDFNVQESAASSWLPFDAVQNIEVADMEYLRDSYAIGGCDLSATADLTCATLLIRKSNDENVYVLQMYFLPQKRIDELRNRGGRQEAPYELWAEQGWLTICEGATVNYSDVTQWFADMVQRNGIRPLWVCYDRALSGYWVPEMESKGFLMERTPQGSYTWTYPMKDMGGTFTAHKVVYQNNPILKMCLLNTSVKSQNRDGVESIQPIKSKRDRRIDGAVSLLNAWVGYSKHYDEYMQFVR